MKAGELKDRLTIQKNEWPVLSVSSVTRVGSTATATTAAAHEYQTGDRALLSGANQPEYNGEFSVTVTGPTTFTFDVSGTPATPGTGAIASSYVGDDRGGRRDHWVELATVWGAINAMSASERMALGGMSSLVSYRAVIRYRVDVLPTMRVAWTPYRAAMKTLQIHGVSPEARSPRGYLQLDLGEAA